MVKKKCLQLKDQRWPRNDESFSSWDQLQVHQIKNQSWRYNFHLTVFSKNPCFKSYFAVTSIKFKCFYKSFPFLLFQRSKMFPFEKSTLTLKWFDIFIMKLGHINGLQWPYSFCWTIFPNLAISKVIWESKVWTSYDLKG